MATLYGSYRIEAEHARGGWSVVHRAVDDHTGGVVALKVLAPELADDPGFRARFAREQEIATSLDHANLIPVLATGDGWTAMRWIDGDTLRELAPLAPARVAAIVAQVAAALDALHARRLAHRDVKPGNVLVERATGRAYLTDLGLAKPIDADPGLTDAGRWLGTVDYAAPELILGGPPNERSDVYALGATVYQAVTGTVPFPGAGDEAKMRAHLREPPPEHDSPLDAVVRRAMAKDPADRFPRAGELAAAALAAASG